MYAIFCASIIVTIVRLIACEDECGPPPETDLLKVSKPSASGYVLGSKVTYKCDYGYVIGGIVKTSTCVKDPDTDEIGWTKPEITCNPRSCGDPGFVENARRVGSRFTFPNNVQYVCNDGYRLSGSPRRYCEASGVWSGTLPSCNIISCGRPEDPENGRAIYTSLYYDSELTYECSKDFQISSNEARFCGADGQWTGSNPSCREIECEMPKKPDFGSAELVGNKPKLGSIVVYKCDPGRELVGSSSSKCIKSGEWTFPTPECVEPCVIPAIANGELGKYEEEYHRYRWRTVFKKVSAGTILGENEQVKLKCDKNYVPNKAESRTEITITCQRGQLTPEPECVSTSCLGDPPPTENGRPVIRARYHGYSIWYTCDSGFEKRSGKVECVYGSWIGNPPVCVDTRCHKSTLNYPGLVRNEGFVSNGRSFIPVCLTGYEVTEKADKKIHCSEGRWTGNLPPCTAAKCRTEDLAGFSGLVLGGSHHLDEGDSLQPKCSEGFEFSNKLDSKIYCHGGAWQGNLPPCSPAHCANNPPVPDNGRIKSFRTVGHGSSIEYECLPLYEMDGNGNVVCNHGQWTGSPPTCKDSRCYLRNLHEKEGVDLTNDGPVNSNRRANIVCIKGFNLRYPDIYCEHGEWKTQNLLSPCQENECEVEQIPNGEILKERSVPIKNWWGRETGTDTVREAAVIGTSESSGAVLYVECNSRYRFQGEGPEEQVKITCRRGGWTPFPVCMLPGELPEAELPKPDEEITDVNLPVHPTLSILVSDHKTGNLNNNRSTEIRDQEPFSTNNSLEVSDVFMTQDNSSTENGEVVTDATVSPPCSCKYIVSDRFLLAHDGKKLIKYGEEIPSGTIIEFYCNTTGIYRFRGSPSLKCPDDCSWHSSMFPSCVSPTDSTLNIACAVSSNHGNEVYVQEVCPVQSLEPVHLQTICCLRGSILKDTDVIIRVFADPTRNMDVGPGGVLLVIPGTQLELVCRAKTGYNQKVAWTVPVTNGIAYIDNSERLYYVIQDVSPINSGKYTCSKTSGEYHSVDIEVKGVECPEIEVTEELGISYTPNREFGGRATFHCFSPYMRNGPSFVTCQASGFWSGPPASCYLPTCSMDSLYEIIPEGIVPLIDGEIIENFPLGHVQRLGCDAEGRVLVGDNTAMCSTEGKWRVGIDFRCVSGCAGLQKKNGSVLLTNSNKEFYNVGESIIFSCPQGKHLTIDVQRILCFKSGWTPDTIPDCQ